MAKQSRLTIAKPDIVKSFDDSNRTVFQFQDISANLEANRKFWRLSQSTGPRAFLEYLLQTTKLKKHTIEFPNRIVLRYTWGEVDILELVQSLDEKGYFSHYSAMWLHGLTDQLPKTVYFNIEQVAAGSGTELTQKSIDFAFRMKPKITNRVAKLNGNRVVIVSGKNTDCLGVTQQKISDRTELRVTDIERTLIDIVVRPVYSGGVSQVANAFKEAAGKFSVNRLCAYLRQLNFTYPYHQAIGFYMEHSGQYKKSQLNLLRQFPIKFEFYLAHAMREKQYIDAWSLHVPKGFELDS